VNVTLDGAPTPSTQVGDYAAVEGITLFGEQTGAGMHREWTNFWQWLFATFRDGGILSASKEKQCAAGETVNCTAKLQPNSDEVGYDEDWRGRIVTENPERYKVPQPKNAAAAALEARKLAVMSGKRKARSV
jgi:hypothetical protein